MRKPEAGAEFVFAFSADRKNWNPVSVIVLESIVLEWQREHTRELNSTERYALAKLALFAAFDQRAAPAEMSAPVTPDSADLTAFAEHLGFE